MVNVNKNVNIFSVNSNHHRTSGTRTYTRAMGQHSVFSQAGWHGAARSFNAYDTHTVNLNRYSRMREGLNNRWDNYEHYHYGPQGPQEQNPSLLETLMMAIPLGKQIFDFGKDIAKTFNIGGGTKTSKSNPTDKGNGVDPSGGNGVDPSGGTPPKSSGLGNAQSFADIKTAEDNLNSSKNDITTNYAQNSVKDDVHALLHDPDVESGLEHIGMFKNFDESKLELKNINLTAPTDYKTALDDVETDIQEIGDFGKEINTASGKVDTELGKVAQSIQSVTDNITTVDKLLNNPNLTDTEKKDLTQQKTDLEKQKNELEQKQTKLNAAKTALADVKTKIETCKTGLESAKTQISEMQKQENELKDQKYDKAKQEDKKLGEVNKQITDINSKIEKIKADGITSEEQSKYIGLMDQLSKAREIQSQLTSSLTTLGSVEVQNSKGKTYTIKNLATNSQTADGGGGATQIIHNYAEQGVEDGLQAKNGFSPFIEDYD